jgi:hypothetical protein
MTSAIRTGPMRLSERKVVSSPIGAIDTGFRVVSPMESSSREPAT